MEKTINNERQKKPNKILNALKAHVLNIYKLRNAYTKRTFVAFLNLRSGLRHDIWNKVMT